MKGFLRMAAVMAASAVMLSGCSDKAAETNETAETTEAQETAETGARLTITAEPVTDDEYGSGGSQNDPEEDHSEFTSVNYIYSRDLTEDDIMDVMSEAEAVASYTGADGQTVEEVLPFADNIEFKA